MRMDYFKSFGIEVGKGNHQQEMIYGIALAYNLIQKEIFQYLESLKLNPAKFNVLMVIKHIGETDGISQAEIGKRLIVTASNMTRLLDKLQKEGLITRSSAKDRRVNVIKISKKGSEILDKVWPGYLKIMESQVEKLKIQEQRTLAGLLIKWVNEMAVR